MREEYGDTPFANGCLLARRLVERGVRTVARLLRPRPALGRPQAASTENLRGRCPDMDRAVGRADPRPQAAGPARRDAVVWGGEFGRTPVSESGDGRDHNPYGFTMFMAGGGFKGGVCHGATDEFGFRAVENRVSIHDLHATLLHVLGIDHEKLTYRYAGRDFRLTDVFGKSSGTFSCSHERHENHERHEKTKTKQKQEVRRSGVFSLKNRSDS